MTVLVATRSGHKLREIRSILREVSDVDLVDLEAAGVTPSPREEKIEVFESFEENAAAKAGYFHELTGMPTLADDSGLVVDALKGAPGVRSKRFAPVGHGVEGEERDRANNEHLLTLLSDVPLPERTARFVCVAVLVRRDADPLVVRGEAHGLILDRPRGWEGFGYDPLFFDPTLGKSFAELTSEEKDALSHRGRAFRALAEELG